MLFPNAGPDYKYALGFVRTQLSTTTTIALVFGPKILRVFKGQGDKWDQKAKVRSITASFSLNGVGLVPEESPDLYQENEELKVSGTMSANNRIKSLKHSSITGASPETGSPNRVHEDCTHADEQQASEAETGRIFYHNVDLFPSALQQKHGFHGADSDWQG